MTERGKPTPGEVAFQNFHHAFTALSQTVPEIVETTERSYSKDGVNVLWSQGRSEDHPGMWKWALSFTDRTRALLVTNTFSETSGLLSSAISYQYTNASGRTSSWEGTLSRGTVEGSESPTWIITTTQGEASLAYETVMHPGLSSNLFDTMEAARTIVGTFEGAKKDISEPSFEEVEEDQTQRRARIDRVGELRRLQEARVRALSTVTREEGMALMNILLRATAGNGFMMPINEDLFIVRSVFDISPDKLTAYQAKTELEKAARALYNYYSSQSIAEGRREAHTSEDEDARLKRKGDLVVRLWEGSRDLGIMLRILVGEEEYDAQKPEHIIAMQLFYICHRWRLASKSPNERRI